MQTDGYRFSPPILRAFRGSISASTRNRSSFAALTRRRTHGPRLEHTAIHCRHGLFPGRWHLFLCHAADNGMARQTENTGAGSTLDHLAPSLPLARAFCRAGDPAVAGETPKRLSA